MVDSLPVAISILALGVSAVTAWLTLFRRGTVKMTQPTVIFFGPDIPRSRSETPIPKIFLRTLLFSTSKRGRVIEGMHVALSHNETHQNFNIWVYGNGNLVRGSGLFVGETGVAANHHFLAPRDGRSFRFTQGQYRLEVFAHLLGDKVQTRLFCQTLEISPETEASLAEPDAGLYFDWGPDSLRYLPHVENRPPSRSPEGFFKALGGLGANDDQQEQGFDVQRQLAEKHKIAGGQAALLGHFAAHARALEKFLQSTWHHWHNAGEALMHPIGTTSDMKNFGAEDTMALMGELRDLKCEYQHHIVYLRSEVPDFGSDVMRHGYPCEREYSDVLADLRDHIARLEEAAQHVWESEQTLVATSHG